MALYNVQLGLHPFSAIQGTSSTYTVATALVLSYSIANPICWPLPSNQSFQSVGDHRVGQ